MSLELLAVGLAHHQSRREKGDGEGNGERDGRWEGISRRRGGRRREVGRAVIS